MSTLERWRLVLGKYADQRLRTGALPGAQGRTDQALDYLYGREYQGRGLRGEGGGERGPGSLDPSQLTLVTWLSEVRELFPRETVEVIEKHALNRYGPTELITDPQTLERLEPNQQLLRTLLTLRGHLKGEVLHLAQRIVRQVVDEIRRKLEAEVRQALAGRLNRFRHSPMAVAQNFDAAGTLRKNLKHYAFMVNTQLFKTLQGALLPQTTASNHELAPAYALSAKHQLAQLAATGCLNQTCYADADAQLDAVTALAAKVDPVFAAQTAVYAREAGHMKDMPVLLAALLAARDVALLGQVFGRVVNNGKTLRAFVQMVRSGALARKSLGTRPKKLVQQWLLTASEKQLLNAAVGNTPSLADVVKMVHPKPAEAWRAAWFACLIGKAHDEAALPPITQAFERFKRAAARGELAEVPDVPFQMLTALELQPAQWAQIARAGSWQMVRQNLNTFARHGVFEIDGMAEVIAAKLRDPKALAQARAFPYQLLAAYKATGDAVPAVVRDALQDALDASLANVPAFVGRVVVCPDVSGSMSSAVTGQRGSATTSVRCIDVAALVAAAVLRKNPRARVLPFEQDVVKLCLNARDSVMTNAQALAAI